MQEQKISFRHVKEVELLQIIKAGEPLGLYITEAPTGWVVCDNRTGDAWVEEFADLHAAALWVLGDEAGTEPPQPNKKRSLLCVIASASAAAWRAWRAKR